MITGSVFISSVLLSIFQRIFENKIFETFLRYGIKHRQSRRYDLLKSEGTERA